MKIEGPRLEADVLRNSEVCLLIIGGKVVPSGP